ncbi:MAG: DegT/DnrJ/EryC1/StrS family aminotransferase [Thaumarchaeota archaeon]|nr:DegT/DnrJ/EryC1/StrS family aminotransferase [Nitrososphaerota archaeon]
MANEQDVKTIPASDEATGATPDNSVSQSTPTDKGDMIPSYRLKEEADKRRSAENKLAEFEKADDERKALDLTYKERFDKLKDQFEGFKAATEQDKTVSEFSSKLMEAGLPGKIARVASKSTIDLSADNIDSKVKEAIKHANVNKKQAYIMFLDLSNAYGNLNIDALTDIMGKYHIPDKMINFIKRYYKNFKYYVKSKTHYPSSSFTNTENMYDRLFTLPIYNSMTDNEKNSVIAKCNNALK